MNVYEFEPNKHETRLRELYTEYATWVIDEVQARSDLKFETDDVINHVDNDMQTLDRLLPPNGHILLAEVDGQIVGTGALKWLGDDAAEFKRIYVTPGFRGRGIGERIMNDLLEYVMGNADCNFVRLETANFMTSAHKIYSSYGFYEIEAYEGSELMPQLLPLWKFMELFIE